MVDDAVLWTLACYGLDAFLPNAKFLFEADTAFFPELVIRV